MLENHNHSTPFFIPVEVVIPIYCRSVWVYNPKQKCTSCKQHIAWKADNVVPWILFPFYTLTLFLSVSLSVCITHSAEPHQQICCLIRENWYVLRNKLDFPSWTSTKTRLPFYFYFIKYLTMCTQDLCIIDAHRLVFDKGIHQSN